MSIHNGVTLLGDFKTTDSLSLNDWAQIAAIAEYDDSIETTSISLFINKTKETPVDSLSGQKFDIEHENSITTVGAARAGSGDTDGKNRFTGYMYELKVYNTNRSESQITDLIDDSCTNKGSQSCSFCPVDSTDDLSDGVCISGCDIGTYGDDCATCATSGCTDNCRYSDGCEHCSNRLCNTCETFLADASCL